MHIATSAVMEHILYACGWGLVAACSIPLNTLCLIVLKHAKNIDPVTKIFLYSLTTSDLIYCLFRVVPAIFQNATGGVVLGDVFCFIQSFFAGASVQALYPVLLAVNIERYISIEYPLKHRLMVTKQKARIIVSFVWICALIYCVCLGFLENWKSIFKPKLQLCGFSDDILTSILLQCSSYLQMLIMLIIIMLFIRIYVIARRYTRRPLAVQNHKARHIRKNRKASTTFFLMTSTFLLSNIPWIIMVVLDAFGIVHIPAFVVFLCEIMFGLAGIGDVIVYYFRNRSFKEATKEVLKRCQSTLYCL